MTGHKVQGLSLYQGAVVEYPTEELIKSRQCRDPMDTWGFNYCILTRVPDINKIAFLNLPDYQRHMKPYTKSKGQKDYFRSFLKFDEKSREEFSQYVQFCAKKTLEFLRDAKEKLNISVPIDFYKALQEGKQDTTNVIDYSIMNRPSMNVQKSNKKLYHINSNLFKINL